MRYQHIALILITLPAVAVNAATIIVSALHPPRHQTKTMHSGDVILPRQRRKVLGGGANSPRCNLLLRATKIAVRHGVMSSGHSTISLPCPVLKPYKQRVHTMNEVIVSL
jgi:hypothetical protein